jgi:predicted lysophospholipase L1 biosynthesis ABC-type transport system permease subunit
MGLSLRFSDGGWSMVRESIDISDTAALLTTAMYAIGAALALLLSVYLFIGRNMKTYAISRALGVPRKAARRSLTLPLGVLSVLAIPAGAAVGLAYTSRTIEASLESLAQIVTADYVADTSLPAGVIVLCLVSTLAFMSLVCGLFLWKMGKTPPLALLQGDNKRA